MQKPHQQEIFAKTARDPKEYSLEGKIKANQRKEPWKREILLAASDLDLYHFNVADREINQERKERKALLRYSSQSTGEG